MGGHAPRWRAVSPAQGMLCCQLFPGQIWEGRKGIKQCFMLARQLRVYWCTTFKAPKRGGRWDESCCGQCNLAEKGLVAKAVLSSHLSACSEGKWGHPGHLQQDPSPCSTAWPQPCPQPPAVLLQSVSVQQYHQLEQLRLGILPGKDRQQKDVT